MSKILCLNNIKKSFPQPTGKLEILRGINLEIVEGETIALVGASGSGKTTMLQIAGLLSQPSSGDVLLKGENINSLNERRRTILRGSSLGFVYQFHHLLPEFTALENVILPQLVIGKSQAEAENNAKKLLDEFGLAERLTHRPAQLSGGEMQRVAIARALANDPALLLADEPTGNLDDATSETVFKLLMEAVKLRKMTALIATHNLDLAGQMSRKVTLESGVLS